MKVSDRDRNVNKKLVLVVFLVKFISKCWIPTNETVYGGVMIGWVQMWSTIRYWTILFLLVSTYFDICGQI